MTAPTPAIRDTGPARPPRTPGALWNLYRLMLRTQVTRARVLSLGALGLVAVLVGLSIGHSDTVIPMRSGARFVVGFGLAVLAPVATLIFASASLGDPNEDGTLVYLWLRPVARWKIVGAAALASFTVTWPIVTLPMAIAAALTGAGSTLVRATVTAVTLATIGYTGIFVALGLRVKRALVWGLLYIFIWEGYVATANNTAARLAIRSYGRSVVTSVTGVTFSIRAISSPWTWLVPIGVCLVALAYATWRLSHQDIDWALCRRVRHRGRRSGGIHTTARSCGWRCRRWARWWPSRSTS